MSKRQDTLFRYLAMLQLIPRYPQYRATTTLQGLLEERGFSVELRSIQRDLEKLSSKFPLICERNQRPYRWSFDPDYKSNLPALDNAAALTWVMAEEYLAGLLPQIAIDQLSHQFHIAKQFLSGRESNGFAHWKSQVKAIPNGKALIPAQIDNDIWREVTDALFHGKAIDVEYLSRAKNEHRSYTLHPRGIVARHSVTYLLAVVQGYSDVRQFALHRLRSVATSQCAYIPDFDFTCDQYVAKGAFGYPISEDEVQFRALVTPDIAWMLSETPLSENQKLTEIPEQDWCELIATVPNDQQTQWWILGFGAAIRVIEPQAWRDAIQLNARKILEAESEVKQ